MTISRTASSYIVISVLAAGLGIWVWQLSGGKRSGTIVSVKVPELSPLAVAGKEAFDANCAACHGPHAAGTDKGPPLVHDIYNSGHHADEVFLLAARLGVRRHHWQYGDMPPQPQVTQVQLQAIVRYVRELQAANGISSRPGRI